MRKGLIILVLGLVLGGAGFAAIYYSGTASCRAMMDQPQPELGWLKNEFRLSDAEFARVSQLHQEYLPECARRCQLIEEQNRRLRELFTTATNLTPEIQSVLAERARIRAECEAEMMKHFLAVSRTMPPEQGRRYLAWVEAQTSLHGQGMEQRHQTDRGVAPPSHQHHL
jgi:hypothetical protein